MGAAALLAVVYIEELNGPSEGVTICVFACEYDTISNDITTNRSSKTKSLQKVAGEHRPMIRNKRKVSIVIFFADKNNANKRG